MARRTRISLLSCVLALALAGCGSGDDGTIPPDDANQLLSLLAAVEEASSGDCERAQDLAQEFVTSVNDLPNDVDPEVAGELTKAATNLEGLTEQPDGCTETGDSGETGAEPTTSTTDTVTTEEPTTTEETTTDEETTDEETTTLDPPEEEPSGDPSQEPPAVGQGGEPGGGTGSPSGGVGAGGGAG